MNPGFIVRLQPRGPWRFGPQSGARDRVDRIFHSDSLYSAVTIAMGQLGELSEWIAATADAPSPAVQLSSCFPYQGSTLYIVPPTSVWPPAQSSKVRWKGARFIPLSLATSLLSDKPLDEDRWLVDPTSECLLAIEKQGIPFGPFRVGIRTSAGVDRLENGNIELHSTACLEFSEGAGLWCLVAFADEESRARWSEPMRAAFRLLADTGMGGERSRGWGRSETPQITEGVLPELVYTAQPEAETAWWLLSLFSPAADDTVEWQRGNYSTISRGGRIESPQSWGDEKQLLRMVEEGSVLFSASQPKGAARNVAPAEFPHPVYRAGFALAIPIPARVQS
jgi:CRISPR type III-A-associated RAMP protein Csm4